MPEWIGRILGSLVGPIFVAILGAYSAYSAVQTETARSTATLSTRLIALEASVSRLEQRVDQAGQFEKDGKVIMYRLDQIEARIGKLEGK